MKRPPALEGDLDARNLRFAIVASRFNDSVVERLIDGAVESLSGHGADPARLELVRVPGAYDLPLIARKIAESGRADAIIALGAVIRGETAHFEHIAAACAQGLSRVAEETGVPVAFGVLTTLTEEQAEERAGGSEGNRGADAAEAAIRLASLVRRLGSRA
ncbi:MAG: 6,7-dimethyl-8-ribityllumazine synthase [Steroidobacteraceae bacterium]